MRPLIAVVTLISIMALAFWAYRENYATQAALKEVETLQRQIVGLREALSVQRAEWAYLNRPDRLRDLATANFDRLGLLPMEPSQFGSAAQVAARYWSVLPSRVTQTDPFRLTASCRAPFSAATISSAAACTSDACSAERNIGMPITARTAMMAKVTSSSISVRPC